MPEPIVYPAGLPCPQQAPYTPTERRIGQRMPREVFNFQRDRHATMQFVFPPFTPEQAAAFYEWWATVLVDGGAWFAADWPRIDGVRPGVYRFISMPFWALQKAKAGDMRRITVTVEVRGRGELPSRPVIEYGLFYVNFANDLPTDLAPDPVAAVYDDDAVVFDDGSFHSVSPFTANLVKWGPVAKFGDLASPAAWTLEAKFSWTIVANSTARMIFRMEFGTGISRTNYILHFYADAGQIRFSEGGTDLVIGPTTTPGDVHHAAIVRPEGADPDYRLYVDGELIGTGNATVQPVDVDPDGIVMWTGNTADQGSEDYRVHWLRASLGELYTGSTYTIPEDE